MARTLPNHEGVAATSIGCGGDGGLLLRPYGDAGAMEASPNHGRSSNGHWVWWWRVAATPLRLGGGMVGAMVVGSWRRVLASLLVILWQLFQPFPLFWIMTKNY
jgi:hypothetical protein